MNTSWIRARQTKYTAYATFYIAVIIAVLVLANWLANRHNRSVDTTSNKRFSLSQQTEKVVRGLNRNVRITYWDNESGFAQARDLLDRYDALSTKLSVDYVDPVKKPQLARAAGVRGEAILQVAADGGRTQETRSLTEEEVTGAVIRAIKGGERNVCFLSGAGEPSLNDNDRGGYALVKRLLEQETYKAREISLLEKPEVPKDCTVVVSAGPQFDYVQPVVDALRSYVEQGGRAMFLIGAPVPAKNQPAAQQAALTAMLQGWGVTLNRDIVLEGNVVSQLSGYGELMPLIRSYGSHAIVREMGNSPTAFPLSRSLELKAGDVQQLFSTSENSAAATDLRGGEVNLANAKKGPFVIGAAGTRKKQGGGTGEGRFVVVGSSEWMSNGAIRLVANASMFMNMINWLSSDEDLISIRPKDPADRRLQLSVAQLRLLLYTSLIAFPLLAVIGGVATWWKRR